MCRSPKNPQRKPKPSAGELSGSYWKLASLRRSFARPSRKSSKSAASAGKRLQNTTGTDGLKPGRGAGAGLRSSVTVSPTRQWATSLMAAVRNPISPGPRRSASVRAGVKTPTRSTR